ncbi:DUF1641 domain-containing protein [Mycolicibacterium smegmatis]|uniref:DUF1641 domain-containing protein n=1 Tax=Mycolicibacterium smegmatis (strain MKD8) TaxID=1214915 RepID=A0A2U9PNA8_MYCSE|nr:DUF1641 domain-containing protein [Mycolicibacterium smegmatis]AWT53224.1 hypothetical protein D806_022430 [Mycolicibacterium smegmatis MKD8]
MASNGHSAGQNAIDELPDISPADGIRRRLDDPQVAEALNSLLDHADLLAVLVKGLDGFVRRGDDIANNLTSAIGELKALNAADTPIPALAAFKDVDLAGLANSLATLSGGLVKATPALNAVLDSPLTDQRGAEVLSALGGALVAARTSAPPAPRGVRGMWKTLRAAAKDPDVGRGVSYLIEVARVFGSKV